MKIVNANVKPIIRTLTPKDYSAIRPALGITSGSHSFNLRKNLFDTVYPSLVKSIRLKLANNDTQIVNNNAQIYLLAKKVLQKKENQQLSQLLRETVYLHQHIRTWRDEHIQFIKTQIGISDNNQTPMASISGAPNAAALAHQYRSIHEKDPIIPIYQAVLGKQPTPTHELLKKEGFDEYMARLTASAGSRMYSDIQKRVNKPSSIS